MLCDIYVDALLAHSMHNCVCTYQCCASVNVIVRQSFDLIPSSNVRIRVLTKVTLLSHNHNKLL